VTATLPPVRPGRAITGMAAVLLPFTAPGDIDWGGFEGHVARTVECGLAPAVNMDTGFGARLEPPQRRRVLDIARAHGSFVAGAYVDDSRDSPFDREAYRQAMHEIATAGGVPIVFPSWGLHNLPEAEVAPAFAALAPAVDRFLAFELGEMFAPQGRVFSTATFHALLEVPQCVGAKHSSLSRELEWERLTVRDAHRPDFMVLTGNDRAIDMVMYGSDYLLGLAAFAPEHFARRDEHWANGDDRFYALNDELQYLGRFAFRPPVPAYRHDAAMFLYGRGHIASDRTHPASPHRPASDRAVLDDIARALDAYKP
jgi:dihydrodipicolinate synthase/N-acetylneuraminate lyase